VPYSHVETTATRKYNEFNGGHLVRRRLEQLTSCKMAAATSFRPSRRYNMQRDETQINQVIKIG